MTFATIHECKRIEVYSKQVNQPTYKTYIDLDQIQTLRRVTPYNSLYENQKTLKVFPEKNLVP